MEEQRLELKNAFDLVTARNLEDIFATKCEHVAFIPKRILEGKPGLFNVPEVTLKHEKDSARENGYVCCTKEMFLKLFIASGSKNTDFDNLLKKWKLTK
jgi:hypothetical protein